MRISDEERWKNGLNSYRKSLLWQERINKFDHSGGGGSGGFDVRGSVHHSIIHIRNATGCNSVSNFYFTII